MRIILCGFGVVGQSLAKLFMSREDDLYQKYGFKPRIVGAFDARGGVFDGSGLDPTRLLEAKKAGDIASRGGEAASGADIINSVDADVLVEATPSNYVDAEPGMSHITASMRRGMHVVSVNKGPLALAFPSLMELAKYNRVLLRFSGTVGGGTPILHYAKNSLQGEKIISFSGILNGTTNYILTNMARGMQFQAALDDARGRGYVEADESLDLDGLDAAAKLVILANWIMDMKVTLPDIDRTGIRGVTSDDVRIAASKNTAIKLIATCNEGLEVSPKAIPASDPLCVDGTLNAVSFTSEHSGVQTITGMGAGGMETASSILRDLLDVRRQMTA